MGKYTTNEMSGLVGELVLYKTKHGSYFRRRPQRKKPPTEAEKQLRFIFKMVNEWLQPIAPFVRKGFRNVSEKCGARQSAVSSIYKNGLERKGFDSVIHPEQVFVSWGEVGLPEETSVSFTEAQELHYQWSTETGSTKDPRDRAMLLAYNPQQAKALWELSGPERASGAASLSLQQLPSGTYHLYLAFAAADGNGQSGSRYLGEVLI